MREMNRRLHQTDHPMPTEIWILICRTDELTPDRARYVEVAGRELAVFRLSNPDRIIVINNSCPHAGGNLSVGKLVGNEVTCPWHDWTFNLDSTQCTMSEKVCVKRHETRIEDGHLYVTFRD